MTDYISREAAINVLCDVCPAKEFCQDKNKCEDYDRFGMGVSESWGWNIMDVPQYQKVTHWMPLPKPPKEE